MRRSAKPVHACYTCVLNLGDACWRYASPRGQWRGRRCPGFENEGLYVEYERWKKQADVRSGRQLRRDLFRARSGRVRRRAPGEAGNRC